jgi:hypothetical protein
VSGRDTLVICIHTLTEDNRDSADIGCPTSDRICCCAGPAAVPVLAAAVLVLPAAVPVPSAVVPSLTAPGVPVSVPADTRYHPALQDGFTGGARTLLPPAIVISGPD